MDLKSALLELLQRNWDGGLKDLPDTYRVPPTKPDEIERAARLHAQADHSDPFAYGRIKLHLRRGLAVASEVAASANARMSARASQGITFPAVLK